MTDTPNIHSDTLPIWIVPISGWEDEGPSRMEAYLEVAKKWKINIEFSTRLGTLYSYKRAPTVQKEIMEHNENTFAAYRKQFGNDWQQRFSKDVNDILMAK
jgi:hypothetical protein